MIIKIIFLRLNYHILIFQGRWNPVICLSFLDNFLSNLKSKFDHDLQVIKIEHLENSYVVKFTTLEEDNYNEILPTWYINEINQ